MPHADPERRREYWREYDRKRRKEHAEYTKQWREARRDHVKGNARRWHVEHKSRARELETRWRKENPEAFKEIRRRIHLKQKYGVTREQYEVIRPRLDNGPCDLCGTDVPGGIGKFKYDHDHTTGKFRGYLCHGCNVALGFFKDSPRLLVKAIGYLVRNGAPL